MRFTWPVHFIFLDFITTITCGEEDKLCLSLRNFLPSSCYFLSLSLSLLGLNILSYRSTKGIFCLPNSNHVTGDEKVGVGRSTDRPGYLVLPLRNFFVVRVVPLDAATTVSLSVTRA